MCNSWLDQACHSRRRAALICKVAAQCSVVGLALVISQSFGTHRYRTTDFIFLFCVCVRASWCYAFMTVLQMNDGMGCCFFTVLQKDFDGLCILVSKMFARSPASAVH